MIEKQQLTFRDNEVIKLLNEVYILFKEGKFEETKEKLNTALKIDFEYPGVATSLKCANYWSERQARYEAIADNYEKGEYLISQWDTFMHFVQKIGDVSEVCLYNIKQYVLSLAVNHFLETAGESEIYDTDILLALGRCYKGLGNYEKAIELLETANQQKSGQAKIMAELADCYFLVNEDRAGKIFFREALFIEPADIDLLYIEATAIHRLVDKLREKGIAETEIIYWLPVYAAIYGIFNIKRELRPIEVGKLKQSIYQMESVLGNQEPANGQLIPRLINHYFWLIDHYMSTGDEKTKIDEVLAKIKKISPEIYKEYTQ
jgi:tetratricopeptide (TPR) repeat protein